MFCTHRRLRRDARRELFRRRAKRDFYQPRPQLVCWRDQKPAIVNALGFWVADPAAVIGDLISSSLDIVIPEHFFMLIDKIDFTTRICTVKYIPAPSKENPDLTPDIQQTFIAYDHPTLSWYAPFEPPGPFAAASIPQHQNHKSHHHSSHHKQEESDPDKAEKDPIDAANRSVSGRSSPSYSSSSSSSSDEMPMEDPEVKQQEILMSAHLELLRFKPVLYSPDGAEMDSRYGTVTSYNVQQKMIGIEFRQNRMMSPKSKITTVAMASSENAVVPEIEWLPYDHPYLTWLQPDGNVPASNANNPNLNNNIFSSSNSRFVNNASSTVPTTAMSMANLMAGIAKGATTPGAAPTGGAATSDTPAGAASTTMIPPPIVTSFQNGNTPAHDAKNEHHKESKNHHHHSNHHQAHSGHHDNHNNHHHNNSHSAYQNSHHHSSHHGHNANSSGKHGSGKHQSSSSAAAPSHAPSTAKANPSSSQKVRINPNTGEK